MSSTSTPPNFTTRRVLLLPSAEITVGSRARVSSIFPASSPPVPPLVQNSSPVRLQEQNPRRESNEPKNKPLYLLFMVLQIITVVSQASECCCQEQVHTRICRAVPAYASGAEIAGTVASVTELHPGLSLRPADSCSIIMLLRLP